MNAYIVAVQPKSGGDHFSLIAYRDDAEARARAQAEKERGAYDAWVESVTLS